VRNAVKDAFAKFDLTLLTEYFI